MDYLWPCVAVVWASFIWSTYLEWRQRKVYRDSNEVPQELKDVFKQETFDKSRCYQLDQSTYAIAHSLYKQVEFMAILALGMFPVVWDVSGDILEYFNYGEDHEVLQSVVFIVISVIYSVITDIPWSVYKTFVLEEKHGFNKQTVWFFIKDHIKSFLLELILVPLIVGGLIYIIIWGGDYFYIYSWLFVLVVSLAFIMLYHDLIAPLFDKFTPLPEGELRVAIEKLAASLKFPLKKLYVVEGSKRSAHSNAYFYGFGSNKCIVLFDTLLKKEMLSERAEGKKPAAKEDDDKDCGEKESKQQERVEPPSKQDLIRDYVTGDLEEDAKEKESDEEKGCTVDEIAAILAHELGHWSLSHNLKNIVIAELNFFLCFFLFGFFMSQQDMFTSFGFPNSRPVIIGLIVVFELIFTPYNLIYHFIMVQMIRHFEYQADEFAVGQKLGGPLREALTKLVKENLFFPIADPLYSAFKHTHPTFLERIRALKKKE